jgi:hypothetical protein
MSLRLGLTGLFVAVILAGCGLQEPEPSSSVSGGVPLRTFAWRAEQDGGPVGCPAFAAAHPVSGVLRGDPNDPQEPVWLEGQSGTRLSIVWPAGFTASFEPGAVLRDEGGVIVAKAGDRVELGQVDAFEHAGTFGDPYLASGLVFHGCYGPLP